MFYFKKVPSECLFLEIPAGFLGSCWVVLGLFEGVIGVFGFLGFLKDFIGFLLVLLVKLALYPTRRIPSTPLL